MRTKVTVLDSCKRFKGLSSVPLSSSPPRFPHITAADMVAARKPTNHDSDASDKLEQFRIKRIHERLNTLAKRLD